MVGTRIPTAPRSKPRRLNLDARTCTMVLGSAVALSSWRNVTLGSSPGLIIAGETERDEPNGWHVGFIAR